MLIFVRQIITQQSSGFFFFFISKDLCVDFFSSTSQYSSHSMLCFVFFCKGFSFFSFPLSHLPYLQPLSSFRHTMTLTAVGLCWHSLSPLAKHMPTTSLTFSSLQKWTSKAELQPQTTVHKTAWLSYTILGLSIARIHSTASVCVCVGAHLGEAGWQFHWYGVLISTHQAILPHISNSSWSCKACRCM